MKMKITEKETRGRGRRATIFLGCPIISDEESVHLEDKIFWKSSKTTRPRERERAREREIRR